MHVIADTRSREMQEWLEDVNDRRRDEICLGNMRQLIRKKETLTKPEELFVYDHHGQSARYELNSKLDAMIETVKNWQSTIVIFEESSVNDCSKKLLGDAVGELKHSVSKLVLSYTLGLEKLSDKYEKDVAKMKEDKNCVLDNDVKLLDEAVYSVKDCYKSLSAKFEDFCNRQVRTIETTIEGFSRFLRDFNFTWKKQASRLLELQDTVGRVVHDLSVKSEKSIGELEKKLNSYCQQLSQATYEDKMKQQMPEVFKILNLISEKYERTYEDECSAMKNYVETVSNEVPKIIKEFNDILEPHGYRNDPPNNTEESNIDSSQDEPIFLRKQWQLCQNLVKTILDWKSSLMNEIVQFAESFPHVIEDAAMPWQETILSERSAVLQMKLDANFERREQIQSEIHDVRVQEIEEHKKRLENHETEVNQILRNTSNRVEEFVREHKQFMQTFATNMTKPKSQLAVAKSTTELNRLQKEVEGIRRGCKNEMEQKVKLHKREVQESLNLLMSKNEEFLQDIQLFKDGGNFSADEAKSYRKTLTSLSKTISNLEAANMQRLDKVLKELDVIIEPIFEETLENCDTNLMEMKFFEDARNVMAKCAAILERQVHRLLEDDTNCVNAVFEYIDKSPRPLCESSTMKFTQLLDSLHSRLDHLTTPFPMGKSHALQEPAKSNRKRSVPNKKKAKLLNKAMNYSSLLFQTEGMEFQENGFSVAAMNIMVKTIEQIQAEATKFFDASSKRNETKVTYNEYMGKILQRMNCYVEQLEDVWRQEVRDSLAASDALEDSLRESILASLGNFNQELAEITRKTIEGKLGVLDEAMRVRSTRRDDILTTFEVSDHHPVTRDSLDRLTNEVVLEEQRVQDTIVADLTRFKEDSAELTASFETSLWGMADPLKIILSKFEDRTKRQQLRNLLVQRTSSYSPKLTDASDALDLSKKSKRRAPRLKQKLSFSSEDRLDIEALLNDYLQNAKEIYNCALEEADNRVGGFVKAGEEFKQCWKMNMNTVAEIYEISV